MACKKGVKVCKKVALNISRTNKRVSNYFCHDISLSQNSYFMVMDNFSTIFVDKCPICQSKIIFIQKRPKSKLRNGTHKMKTHCNGDLRPKIVAMHVSA